MYHFCLVASLRPHERETKKVVEINVWLQDTSGGKATGTAQEKLLRQVLFPVYKVFCPLVILAICILFKMLRSL